MALLEAQVAVGENPDQLAVFGNRQTGDAVLVHDLLGVGDLLVWRHGNRIRDHAALEFFDFLDFAGLSPYRQIAMDNSQTAFLGHGNRGLGLGHSVHRRAHQREC